MIDYSKKHSGILLAGGKSSRMGEDKAFMKYKNRYLYEYGLSILHFFSGDILVSSSDTRFDNQNYSRIEDEIPNLGPLGGIYSCLRKIKNNTAIILPCDLPMITTDIIDLLISQSDGYEITIPLNQNNLPEPLIGIYSTSLIPIIEKMIYSKNYKMQSLLKDSNSNLIKIPELDAKVFNNINSQGDFYSLSLI